MLKILDHYELNDTVKKKIKVCRYFKYINEEEQHFKFILVCKLLETLKKQKIKSPDIINMRKEIKIIQQKLKYELNIIDWKLFFSDLLSARSIFIENSKKLLAKKQNKKVKKR